VTVPFGARSRPSHFRGSHEASDGGKIDYPYTPEMLKKTLELCKKGIVKF